MTLTACFSYATQTTATPPSPWNLQTWTLTNDHVYKKCKKSKDLGTLALIDPEAD